jgi:hypothetical protein
MFPEHVPSELNQVGAYLSHLIIILDCSQGLSELETQALQYADVAVP